jgi:hypothetical protein
LTGTRAGGDHQLSITVFRRVGWWSRAGVAIFGAGLICFRAAGAKYLAILYLLVWLLCFLLLVRIMFLFKKHLHKDKKKKK